MNDNLSVTVITLCHNDKNLFKINISLFKYAKVQNLSQNSCTLVYIIKGLI